MGLERNPTGLTCGSLGFLLIVGGSAEIGTIPRVNRGHSPDGDRGKSDCVAGSGTIPRASRGHLGGTIPRTSRGHSPDGDGEKSDCVAGSVTIPRASRGHLGATIPEHARAFGRKFQRTCHWALNENPAGLTCGSFGFQLNRKGAHTSPSNPAGLTCGSLGFLLIVGGLAEIGTIPRVNRGHSPDGDRGKSDCLAARNRLSLILTSRPMSTSDSNSARAQTKTASWADAVK